LLMIVEPPLPMVRVPLVSRIVPPPLATVPITVRLAEPLALIRPPFVPPLNVSH